MAEIRSSPSGPEVLTDGLEAGTYIGQPVIWNGTEYIPITANGNTSRMRLLDIRDPLGSSGRAFGIITENDVGITLHANNVDANIRTVVGTQASESATSLALGFWSVSVRDTAVIECLVEEGQPPRIGFLGATAVERPVITGATTQEQIDSLVAAGVALGLWTDGR